MDKKQALFVKLAVITTLFLFIFLFFCWRSSQAYETLRTETLTRLQQVPGIAVSWLDDESSLLHRHGHIQISILAPEEWFASPSMPTLPPAVQTLLRKSGTADLYLELDTLLLPGMIRGSAELMYDRGTAQELLTSGQMQSSRQRIRWQFNGFSNTLSAQLDSEGLILQTRYVSAMLQPSMLKWQLNEQGQSLSWQLPGVHLQHDENVLELAGANGSLSFVPGNNGAPLPTLELSFQRGKLATAEEQLGLGELTLYSTINRNQQGILSLVDADWQGALGSLDYRHLADDKQFACSSVYLSMRWHDLEQQGVRELLSQLGNLKPDQAPVLAAINRITRSGFAIDLDRFDLKLPQGELKAAGALSSRPFDMAQLTNLASIRSLLQASIEIRAHEQLAAALLTGEEDVIAMEQADYVEHSEQQMLGSRVRMVNGKLSANGVALPW